MRMLAYFDIRAENAACFGDDNDDIESIQKQPEENAETKKDFERIS